MRKNLIVSGKDAVEPSKFRFELATPIRNVESMELSFASVPFSNYTVTKKMTLTKYALVKMNTSYPLATISYGNIIWGNSNTVSFSTKEILLKIDGINVILTVDVIIPSTIDSNTVVKVREDISSYDGSIIEVVGSVYIFDVFINNSINPTNDYIVSQITSRFTEINEQTGHGSVGNFTVSVDEHSNKLSIKYVQTDLTGSYRWIHGSWDTNNFLGLKSYSNSPLATSNVPVTGETPIVFEKDPYIYLVITNLEHSIVSNFETEGHHAFALIPNDKSIEMQIKNSCFNKTCFSPCIDKLQRLDIEFRDTDGDLYDFYGKYPTLGFILECLV